MAAMVARCWLPWKDRRKGSDYLWRAWLRPLWTDPDFYLPLRQAALSGSELAVLFRDDTGQQPMPGFDLHLDMARLWRDLSALSWSLAGLVALANSTVQPLMTLLSLPGPRWWLQGGSAAQEGRPVGAHSATAAGTMAGTDAR